MNRPSHSLSTGPVYLPSFLSPSPPFYREYFNQRNLLYSTLRCTHHCIHRHKQHAATHARARTHTDIRTQAHTQSLLLNQIPKKTPVLDKVESPRALINSAVGIRLGHC